MKLLPPAVEQSVRGPAEPDRAARRRFGLARPGWVVRSVSLVLLAAVLGACSAPSGTSGSVQAPVSVNLQDFKLTASTINLRAGKVTFEVTNDGPSTHEFNVDRTDVDAAALPIDASGLFVAEDSASLHREGSVESAGLGTRHKLTLVLAPGRYVFYCDLEGHYLSGMHAQVYVH